MSKLVVTIDEARGVIALRPLGYDERVRFAVQRLLPARWEKARQRWEMPATAGARMRYAEALPELDALTEIEDDGTALVVSPLHIESGARFEVEVSAELRRHQHEALIHLAHNRQHLGSHLLNGGMGIGKTFIALAHVRSQLPRAQRALVITPKSVIAVWAEQAARFTPDLRLMALDEGTRGERVAQAIGALNSGSAVVAVIGWAVLERLTPEQKRKLRDALAGATIIADEVHAAKAPGSARSQALAFISTRAAMRIGMSGTPLAHSPMDSYGLFRFLDPGVFGTAYSRFRDTYAVMGGFEGHQVLGFRNLDDLTHRIAPFTHVITRDVLDLPEVQDIDIPIKLPENAQVIYRMVRDEAVAELKSGTLVVANALAKIVRLQQLTSGHLPSPSGLHIEEIHTAKRDALVDLFESSDDEEPWVVFGRFSYDMQTAHNAATMTGRPSFELSGRAKDLDRWKEVSRSGKGAVLAVNYQAGAFGIDLTAAHLCAFLSPTFALADYEQARARVHRPPQSKPVSFYHLNARGTIDIDVRRALARRADVLSAVKTALLEGQEVK